MTATIFTARHLLQRPSIGPVAGQQGPAKALPVPFPELGHAAHHLATDVREPAAHDWAIRQSEVAVNRGNGR